MSAQTPTQEQPFIPVGTVVSYKDRGRVNYGRIIAGTKESVVIEEIVPTTDGARAANKKEMTSWEFKSQGNVQEAWTEAARNGLDLRTSVDRALRGVNDKEILEGFLVNRDPGDEQQEEAPATVTGEQVEEVPVAQEPDASTIEKAPEPEPEPEKDAESKDSEPKKGKTKRK